MIDRWIEVLFNDTASCEIKSSIMQILYLVTESEVAMVILQQTDFINNLFMFLDNMFNPKYDRYY